VATSQKRSIDMPHIAMTEDELLAKLKACGHLLAELMGTRKGGEAFFSDREESTLDKALGLMQRKQKVIEKEERRKR
jgi:hypothetical protein